MLPSLNARFMHEEYIPVDLTKLKCPHDVIKLVIKSYVTQDVIFIGSSQQSNMRFVPSQASLPLPLSDGVYIKFVLLLLGF